MTRPKDEPRAERAWEAQERTNRLMQVAGCSALLDALRAFYSQREAGR